MIFQQASRLKLRFESNRGLLSTEDLWDLKLTDLNDLAKAVNRKLKEEQEESFITVRSASNTAQELRLEILKEVIATKIADDEAKKVRIDKKAQKDFLKDLLEKKQLNAMEGLSIEEIQARLDALTD